MLATIDLPEGIIVNIREARMRFERAVMNNGELNYRTDEILHTIVNCCRDKRADEWQLHEFVSETEFSEMQHNGNGCHSDAVLLLGLEVMFQIRSLNLYENDELPYEFEVLDNSSFHDLFLRRIND
jgi:hypothetical protein